MTVHVAAAATGSEQTLTRGSTRDGLRGFRAALPLWLGIVPFGVAFGMMARSAGFSVFEAQLMSITVFAGSAQLQAVALLSAGAGVAGIVTSTLLINLRHVLYGVALRERVHLSPLARALAAHLLTDEAFGVFAAAGERSFAFLLGVELSMFLAWNAATLAGTCFGRLVPSPERYGVDFVFPLAFLTMLVLSVRSRRQLGVAALAAGLAFACKQALPGELTLLVAAGTSAAVGAALGAPGPAPQQEISRAPQEAP